MASNQDLYRLIDGKGFLRRRFERERPSIDLMRFNYFDVLGGVIWYDSVSTTPSDYILLHPVLYREILSRATIDDPTLAWLHFATRRYADSDRPIIEIVARLWREFAEAARHPFAITIDCAPGIPACLQGHSLSIACMTQREMGMYNGQGTILAVSLNNEGRGLSNNSWFHRLAV